MKKTGTTYGRDPREGRPSSTSREFKEEYIEQYAAYETLYSPYPVPTRTMGTWVLERERMADTAKNRAKIRDLTKTFHPGHKSFNETKYGALLNTLREKYKNQIVYDLKSDSRLISQLVNHVYRKLIEGKSFKMGEYTDLLKTQLEIQKYFDEKDRMEKEHGLEDNLPSEENGEISSEDLDQLELAAKDLGLLE